MCETHCSQHCYNGDPLERVHYLERQLKEARQQMIEYRAKSYWLDNEVKALRKKNRQEADDCRFAYWQGKVERQRQAINAIQKKGWMPTLIIREDEDVAA